MQDISKPEKPTVKKRPSSLFVFLVFAGIVSFLSMFSMCGGSKDYKKRSYVAEGIALSAVVKVASADFYEKEKHFPNNNKEAGLAEPNTITGQAVSSVTIKPNGMIVITYNNKVKENVELWMKAEFKEGKIIWQCIKGNDPEKAIKLGYLPANCRSAIMDKS